MFHSLTFLSLFLAGAFCRCGSGDCGGFLMPFPSFVGQFNRCVTNPLLHPFAGSLGSLGLLELRGRRSGRIYRVPIMAFPASDRFAILLTYGEQADWVRNIQISGSALLTWRKNRYQLVHPVIVPGKSAGVHFPRWARLIVFLVRADRCLVMTVDRSDTPGGVT
jgi:deazaflavin-dependent oxidoreductase (nitroreductase family)